MRSKEEPALPEGLSYEPGTEGWFPRPVVGLTFRKASTGELIPNYSICPVCKNWMGRDGCKRVVCLSVRRLEATLDRRSVRENES